MATPTQLKISAASFATIRDKLDDGFGFFEDGSFTYVVLDAKTHVVDVLRRQDNRLFSELMKNQPPSVRVSINGQLFGPRTVYLDAVAGVVNPHTVMGEGSIREAGRTHDEDRVAGKTRYFFGRSKDGKHYRSQLGNPPEDIYEGMGGVGPMIITNPATGGPLKVGVGNVYASDSGKTNIPETDEEWKDCTQRNSGHFEVIDTKKGEEFTAVATHSSEHLLLFAINTDVATGQLSKLRDKLLDVGFDCACFMDGASSACMAVDNEMVVAPAGRKDRIIEAGFRGVKGGKPVKLRVKFTTLDVVDPAVVEGDEGLWRIRALANGETFGTWGGARAIAGESLDLDWEVELEVTSAGQLGLELLVENVVPATITGVEGPEIANIQDLSDANTDPPFGEGAWVKESSDGFYKLHFKIEVL